MTPRSGRSRLWRWLWRAAVAGVVLLLVAIGGVAGVLYGSLPRTTGEVTVSGGGLNAPVAIARDEAGVVTITAQTGHDAYYALGYAHAQDRMFQMDMIRRLGAGRLSEVYGSVTVRTDKLMRTLGLTAQAQAQFDKASPELKAALEAYAAGVNAEMRGQWIPSPERLLRWHPREPWQPTDSLLWGRLMAWQLSGNAGTEIINEHLRTRVKPGLLPLLLREEGKHAALPGFAPSRAASNNWAIAGRFTESGAPIFANDPHLGLTAPATWYMARIVTPDLSWAGATAPGLPFLVIGTNGHVAWGFTTTHSDTQDLFEERLLADPTGNYQTPAGPMPLEIRHEVIKVAGGAEVAFDVRATRHGPLISDLDPERYLHRHFALAWAGFWSDDRTPEAFLRMNQATDAASFSAALRDFHTPEQNVVFADTKGSIGFVAAGRVPVRHSNASRSIFPVPGWTNVHEWTGTLAFDELPQLDNPSEGRIITANNDIRPPGYDKFIGHSFDRPYRRDRIAELLSPLSAATVADMQRIQLDPLSAPVFRFVKTYLPEIAGSMPIDIAATMSGWDGRMDAERPEPLIAIAWLHATAQRVLADDLGEDFDDWWFWQVDTLEGVMRDGRFCDDAGTTLVENCRDMLRRAMADAIDRLHTAHGQDWRTWRWGAAHTMYYRHPIFGRIPYAGDYVVPSVPASGDQFTISRAGMAIREDGATFPDVHGPGMRMVVDLSRPAALSFNLAGGQSGHPLSPHYSDLLLEWAAGTYRTFQAPAEDILTLRPAP